MLTRTSQFAGAYSVEAVSGQRPGAGFGSWCPLPTSGLKRQYPSRDQLPEQTLEVCVIDASNSARHEREIGMHFFLGTICGVLLTVLAAFLADSVTTANEPPGIESQRIVNWDLAGARVAASVDTIREQVHDLTR